VIFPAPDGVLLVRNDWRAEVYFIDARGESAPRLVQPALVLQGGGVDRGGASEGLAAVRDSVGVRLVRTASTPNGDLSPNFLGSPLPVSTGYMAMTRTRLYLLDNTTCKIWKYDITDPAAAYSMGATSSLLWSYGAGLAVGGGTQPGGSPAASDAALAPPPP